MKKILILYAKYGGGHFSAANAIYNYLKTNENLEIEMIDCIEYINKFLNTSTTGAYKFLAKKAPQTWKKIYYGAQKGVLSKVSNSTNVLMAKKLNKLFKQYQPNIVISTHPFSTQMTSYIKRHYNYKCQLSTILTDFQPHDQWLVGHEYCDQFFVSNENIKEQLINKYKINENKIHVTGVPISPRFLETFNDSEIYKEFNLNPSKKTILFFGGGEFGLGEKRTVEILKALCKHLDNYQIIAVSGKNKKMNIEFLNFKNSIQNNDLHVFEYINKVPELMHISSVIFTKPGGLTSSESLVSSLPMVIINPIPGQEEENAEFLEKSGVGIWLKKDDDIDSIISSLLNDINKLKTMSECCKKLAKPNSTKEICKYIEQ